jgi:hypothetical protein
MSVKSRISKLLFGLSVPQEYVCLENEKLIEPFSFFLSSAESGVYQDITATHIFLGYKPVIIGVPIDHNNEKMFHDHDNLCISVSGQSFYADQRWKGFQTPHGSVARMILKKKEIVTIADTRVALLESDYGEHFFLSGFHQRTNDLKRKAKPSRKDFIKLDGNLAEQVRIAYAIPRVISLIALLDGNGNMNMFPTDLHGGIEANYYASSLRIGGKANAQVELNKRIVLSDVDCRYYKEVYGLGKNHMKDPQPLSQFDVVQHSELFGIPLPSFATSYRELEVIQSVDLGIHRIHFYKAFNRVVISSAHRLTHFHQYAAQWRENKGLHTPALFR